METPNRMCIGCNQYGTTCQGTTETVWSGCIYKNTSTPPISSTDFRVSIYEAALKALPPEDIDHHETDLYLRVSKASKRLVSEYAYRQNVTTFKDNIEGRLWYDIPFAYTPAWADHWERTHKIHSITYDKHTGEYTVKYADILDGKITAYTGNSLKETEAAWAKECKNYHEDKFRATWTN